MQMSSPGPSFTWSSTEHARQLGASVLLAPREGRPDGTVSFRRHSAVSSLSGSQNDDDKT